MKKKKEASQEFKERKSLMELQIEIDKTKHNYIMLQLGYERANSKLIHDQILERGRIHRAEERKMLIEKKMMFRGYK